MDELWDNENLIDPESDVLQRLFDESPEAEERLSDPLDYEHVAATSEDAHSRGVENVVTLEELTAAAAAQVGVTEVGACLTQCNEIAAVVYSQSDHELSLEQVIAILKKPNQNFLSQSPPVKPSTGSIFVFPSSVDKTTRRCDQYHWLADGAKSLPRKAPAIKKYYFQTRMPDGTKSNKFRRHEYELLSDQPAGAEYVLVQYIGDSTVADYNAVHGNISKSSNIYVRTAGTVKLAIQANRDKSPKKVYSGLMAGVKSSGVSEAVMKPRNTAQVRNFQKAARRVHKISHDGLYSCLELAVQFPDYLSYIQVHPQLVIHISSSSFLAEFEKMFSFLQKAGNSEVPELQYDTTFALGDFYVSVLSVRHGVFKGSPVIPLAFMIHERKYMKDHERFMDSLKEKCKSLQTKKFVLVTDSEFEFSNIFPKVVSVHCWNHIRKNVNRWLRQNHALQDDMRVYSDHVYKLLQSESLSIFETNYDKYIRSWTADFRKYFDEFVKQKIVKFAGRWIVDGVGCYNLYSGITTNAAESLNRVLKDLSRWKERPVDGLIVALKCLQSFYMREIERGVHGLGEFSVRECYAFVCQPVELLPTDAVVKLPDEIVEFVRSGLDSSAAPVEQTRLTRQLGPSPAAEVLAKEAVESHKVVFVPSLKSFMVEGSQGSKYAVTLYPKESCQCPALRTCYHILAAKCLIGAPIVYKKPLLNLSQLCKRKQAGRYKKSGRKKPRLGDYEVNPAPDSEAKFESDETNQNAAIPSVSTEDPITKQSSEDDVSSFLQSAPACLLARFHPRKIMLDNDEEIPRKDKGNTC